MESIDKTYLLDHFHDALQEGFIQPYFQPIYRSVTGNIIGAEALARWIDPGKGIIPPVIFIPVLEEAGLVYELDMEILRRTCAFYQLLQQRGTPLNSFSVNLSRQDFRHEDLCDQVISILEEYQVPHKAISLEITETLMIEDSAVFHGIFRKFQDAGFSIWLDDFGSGYSSLNVLQNYNFDVMKFDMLFLRDNTSRGRQLMVSLISMAKGLGIHTLAEGVETEEHRKFLLSAGCEVQQGFYYSQPIPQEKLLQLIEANRTIIETPEDEIYWNEIGRFNFTSPNPMEEYAEGQAVFTGQERAFRNIDSPIALVECSQNEFRYVYASEGYKERLRELGFDNVSVLSTALSNQRSQIFLMIKKLILDALMHKTVQTFEYVYKDVYFKLSVLLLARKTGWAMIAMHLSTFDSEREVKTAQEMLSYSSALISTYELVVLFYLDSKEVKRIYTANDIPVYDREASIEESLRKFCEAEVEPIDQARYMKFMDLKTMTERVEASPKQFIQSVFRMRWKNGTSTWCTARVTQIPAFQEKVHMLTIQNIQGNVSKWLELFIEEHPEFL